MVKNPASPFAIDTAGWYIVANELGFAFFMKTADFLVRLDPPVQAGRPKRIQHHAGVRK